jgi:uncharacterized protein YlxW (UPF0749 family)
VSPRSSLRTAGPALLVGLLSFVLTLDVRAQHEATRAAVARRAELVKIVETREARATDLETRLASLRKQLTNVAAATGESKLAELRRVADRIGELSGAAPVSGPGLLVRVADAPNAERGSSDPDTRIQDVDIQAIVNALWEAGAEAIAINGQRLVATSAIRSAGAAVLVNFRVISSPYRVAAIGDERAMQRRFETSVIARRFQGWAETFGLGFSFERRRSLELPAFTGTLRFRYARPIEGGN